MNSTVEHQHGKDKDEEFNLARNDDDLLMLDKGSVDEGLWLDDGR